MNDAYPQDLGLLINGEWHRGGRNVHVVTNPATEAPLAELPLATEADLDAALHAAQRGFHIWSAMSAHQRARLMMRAAQLLKERKESIARVLTLENGKPLVDSLGELDRAIETIEWTAEEGKRTYGRVMVPRSRALSEMTIKRPVGPVAAFAPWNFPVVLAARKVAAALAAGCSTVIKPAEETPASCIALAQAFTDAGVPAGVINMVFGVPAQVSNHLIASTTIKKVSFTGSVPIGRLLCKLAGEQLKPVTMELGGHSPVIVFDDVDVERIATMCAAFKYRNAGQVCLSPNRFYVHERIYDAFVARFVAAAQRIEVGDGLRPGTKMGPLNNVRRLRAAEAFVEDACARGARIETGGKRVGTRGYFFEPTVLTCVDEGASILNEEPFCPVVPIMPFATTEEAIAKANGVEFGLAAYAFTDSLTRASQLVESLEAGWLGINSFTPSLADAPIGGLKTSGIGYEGGPEGLDAYLHTKYVSQASLV
ncbi:aldehyde dehydrogenase family protein [Paraburkholderia sp. CNPSo 3157]|uniref:Aldehyde dehydrogenase family protein n=1 Tax=Paraburkholderia franconis TaxID=2654983 RepID=A0A7X1NIQ3_9BURK|nr:NAD-dependent succinate-semialdehyde dehydrogenase [Paraburkholderia franconis]MPW22253.1 aldehyde dehydrogenase family protein [Paraburkholderia franconis]